MISTVVLAAGLSRRMGRHKLLLPYGGQSIIEHVVSVLLNSQMDEVIVVTGYRHQDIERVLSPYPLKLVFNPDYARREMLASIQIGMRSVSTRSLALFLTVGDQPSIRQETLVELLDRYRRQNEPHIYIPSYRMRAGHPILIPREYWDSILALPAKSNLREFLRLPSTKVHYVVVKSGSILQDLDTPEDYEQLSRDLESE